MCKCLQKMGNNLPVPMLCWFPLQLLTALFLNCSAVDCSKYSTALKPVALPARSGASMRNDWSLRLMFQAATEEA